MIDPIDSGERLGFRALGGGGRIAVNAYDQIARAVGDRLGQAHKALLAQPSFRANRIDWFPNFESEAARKRLVDADPETRKAGEIELARLADEVSQAASHLRKAHGDAERILGDMIAFALEIPSLDKVWLVGAQPVLTFWGHVKEFGRPVEDPLQALIRTHRPLPPPAEDPAKTVDPPKTVLRSETVVQREKTTAPQLDDAIVVRRPDWRRFVPWLILLMLLLLALFIWGLFGFRLPHWSAAGPTQSAQSTTPPTPSSDPPKPMVLDPTSSIEGCWRAGVALVDTSSNTPITVVFCFSDNGNGKKTIRYLKSDVYCSRADVHWSMSSGTLSIHVDPMTCSNRKSYDSQNINCRPDTNQRARCSRGNDLSFQDVLFLRDNGEKP